ARASLSGLGWTGSRLLLLLLLLLLLQLALGFSFACLLNLYPLFVFFRCLFECLFSCLFSSFVGLSFLEVLSPLSVSFCCVLLFNVSPSSVSSLCLLCVYVHFNMLILIVSFSCLFLLNMSP